jgi:A/G-specific adenine glycosylase
MKAYKEKRNVPSSKVRVFRAGILLWGEENGRTFPWRKRSASNYERVVSEILLQRTRAESVAKVFPRFISLYPSWRVLAQASCDDLEVFLKPLGLWRRRASSLQRLSREMLSRRGRFPNVRAAIEEIPAVGQYVANAVLMFCHNEPQPLLDSNMARVLERFFGPRAMADIRYDPYLQKLSARVVCCSDAPAVNWAILDLAALICTARKPKCEVCPVSKGCCRFKAQRAFRRTDVTPFDPSIRELKTSCVPRPAS